MRTTDSYVRTTDSYVRTTDSYVFFFLLCVCNSSPVVLTLFSALEFGARSASAAAVDSGAEASHTSSPVHSKRLYVENNNSLSTLSPASALANLKFEHTLQERVSIPFLLLPPGSTLQVGTLQ